MKPTKEQELIIDAYVNGEDILVHACAGSGKTSSIVMAAKAIKRNGLYLAFNKAIANEVNGKLPDHVESRTIHSLAYSSIGHEYSNKLSRPKGGYVNVAATPSEITRYFRLKGFMDVNDLEVGKLVKFTVNRFESSSDNNITSDHVPKSLIKEIVARANKRNEKGSNVIVDKLIEYVVKYAKSLWVERTDQFSEVLATHDTYLKLFQLSKPNLNKDVIFLDECQDITPCVYDIVKQQESNTQIVAVGDDSQAIYQWRGAVNAMELFPYQKYTLSQSFRFGQKVADVANMILSGTTDLIIKGNPMNHGVVSEVIENNPFTIISKTNTGVLMNALEYIEQGIPVDIKINVNDFCRILSEAQYLFDGQTSKVKHEDLVGFQSWDELLREAEEDAGLRRVSVIVTQGRSGEIIRSLKSNDPRNALVTCVTAHKSKGLEWGQVVIDNDFTPIHSEKMTTMDRNLIYVAVTRAMSVLELNHDLNKHLMEC